MRYAELRSRRDGEFDRCVSLSAALYCALMLIPIATTLYSACNSTTGDMAHGKNADTTAAEIHRAGDPRADRVPVATQRRRSVLGHLWHDVGTVQLRELGVVGALWAARMAAVEDSRPLRPRNDGGGTCGQLTADWLGILQVVANVAHDMRVSPREALNRMAPRVVGGAPSAIRFHALARVLPARLIALPGYRRTRFVAPESWLPADGPWDLYGPCWDAARRAMRQAVVDGFEPPCPCRPIAEGGAMDDEFARRRGLIRLPCGDALHFWAAPKDRCAAARISPRKKRRNRNG
jgi:hypothetical protein